MTPVEAVAYIHSVVWKGSRPGLSRITELLERLGNPQEGLRFIHVAGTNGKGSFCAMTEAVLRAAGYRTGLFVSPYIKHFNERICLSGQPISDSDLAEMTALVKPHADVMEDSPTEFELITAIGLLYFARKGCDVVVLETGMGGRLDSTNIIRNPLLSVITGISIDHAAYLGDTVEAIAAEKAGIIKAGTPVLWGGRDKSARGVIAAQATRLGVAMHATEDTPLTVHEISLEGATVDYGEYRNIHIPLLGSYQPRNLANVLAALPLLERAGLTIPERAVREGLAGVRWRGRFEKLCDSPLILSDGAHNPEGITAAAESIRLYFGDRPVLLLMGVMADKDYRGMVGDLAPLAARVFTLTPDNPRALSADALAACFVEVGVPACDYASVGEAVRAAVAEAKATGTPLLSLGSLYMYAEVTDVLEEMKIIAAD